MIPPDNLFQNSLRRTLGRIAATACLRIAAPLPPTDGFQDCFDVGFKAGSLCSRVSKVHQKRADLQRQGGERYEFVVFLKERHEVLTGDATSRCLKPAFLFPRPDPSGAYPKHLRELIDCKGNASQFVNRVAEPLDLGIASFDGMARPLDDRFFNQIAAERSK